MTPAPRSNCPATRLLRFLFGALSCLAASPTTAAQEPRDDTRPDLAAITSLLAELDAAFARRDVAAYLKPFAPDHPGAHAMLRRRLERLFAADVTWRRTSEVVGGPRTVGPRTVVRVHHEIVAEGNAGTTFATGELLALRLEGARAVPTFAQDVPVQYQCDTDDFRCPACNYQIGGAPGWLLVPMASDRAQAIDAASFYLLGTDVACDVSVRIDPAQPPALTLVQRLGAMLHDTDPTARPGAAMPWLPPAYREEHVPHLAGARLEVDLPDDYAGRGGKVLLHAVTFGGLQHLALIRGSKQALTERDAAVQELLGSYRLVDPTSDPAVAATLPLTAHTGGELADSTYRNHRFGLEFLGPEGWQAQQRCGGSAFRVAWTSPAGSRLWLIGYTPPTGLAQWCRVSADRWLTQLCANAELELAPPTADEDPWQQRAGGALYRLVVATPKSGSAPATARRRLLQVDVAPDLLVVADGLAINDADEAALRDAFASLVRR